MPDSGLLIRSTGPGLDLRMDDDNRLRFYDPATGRNLRGLMPMAEQVYRQAELGRRIAEQACQTAEQAPPASRGKRQPRGGPMARTGKYGWPRWEHGRASRIDPPVGALPSNSTRFASRQPGQSATHQPVVTPSIPLPPPPRWPLSGPDSRCRPRRCSPPARRKATPVRPAPDQPPIPDPGDR